MNISTPVTAFDDAKAAAFADRLVGTLGEASLALMMSLGHRARLFDTLAAIPPANASFSITGERPARASPNARTGAPDISESGRASGE